MKKNKVRGLLVALLTSAMVAGNTQVILAAPAQATKDETVYVKTDGEGEKTSVTVTDQISNVGSESSIKDISSLTDIENVKGDETFTQNGESLTWNNDGSSTICYQGTSNEALPVDMKISYELNGKTVKYDSLKGKSGHIKINVSYKNHTAGKNFAPFMMMTGILIDGDTFTNIKVEHGKLVSDGDKNIVLGYGFPGLPGFLELNKQELTEDLEIPEGFSLEGDVADFDKITCMSLATNEVFKEVSADDADALDGMKDDMNTLEDASGQLVDGSGALKDGIETLSSSSKVLVEGVKKLDDGGKELAKGTDTLYSGAKELNSGTTELATGTKQLADGSKALVDGSAQIAAATGDAGAGAKQINDGLGEVQSGVASMKDEVGKGVDELYKGAGQLTDGIGQLHSGAESLNAGLAQSRAGAESLAGGISQSKAGAGTLNDNLDSVKQGTQGMSQLAQAMAGAVSPTASGQADVTVHVDNSDIQQSVYAALAAAGADESMIQAAMGAIWDKDVSATVDVTLPVDANTSEIAAYASQLTDTAATVDGGVDQLKAGAEQLEGGLGQLESGSNDLVSGLGQLESGSADLAANLASDSALAKGAATLQGGIGTLGKSLAAGTDDLGSGLDLLKTGSDQLVNGLDALKTGADQLSAGSKTLDDGIKSADTGAQKLSAGTNELTSGAKELNSGANELSSGLGELSSGTDALIEGIQKLFDGSVELHDGMVKFDKDGIKKLINIFDDDLKGMLDKVDDMTDHAKAYTNYSGLADDMEGSVKFIFLTEE